MTADPTPNLRRLDDQLMADIDKRMALVEQARVMDASARDAHFRALERQIEVLAAKIDTVLTTMAATTSDPAASSAGRQLVARLTSIEETVETHDDFVQQMTGALRLARFALGTSFLSVIGNLVLGAIMLANR